MNAVKKYFQSDFASANVSLPKGSCMVQLCIMHTSNYVISTCGCWWFHRYLDFFLPLSMMCIIGIPKSCRAQYLDHHVFLSFFGEHDQLHLGWNTCDGKHATREPQVEDGGFWISQTLAIFTTQIIRRSQVFTSLGDWQSILNNVDKDHLRCLTKIISCKHLPHGQSTWHSPQR